MTKRIEEDSDHWYTPQYIIDCIERTFRRPYEDPCTSPDAHDTINTDGMNSIYEENFLERTRGFDRPVFMNPPYSKSVGGAGAFTDRLIALKPESAIVLVNAATSTAWWHRLAKSSQAICFVKKRIKFDRVVDGVRVAGTSPRYANIIHLIGDDSVDVTAFVREFGELGTIVMP
jgi:hypothetical protein